MAKAKAPLLIAPPVSAEDAQALVANLDHIIVNFRGDIDELKSALGMYMIGRIVGWRVLVLVHNKRTIQKYEKILGGINIRDEFDPVTDFSGKSLAFKIVKRLGNFWKGVNGEYDDAELREGRRKLA